MVNITVEEGKQHQDRAFGTFAPKRPEENGNGTTDRGASRPQSAAGTNNAQFGGGRGGSVTSRAGSTPTPTDWENGGNEKTAADQTSNANDGTQGGGGGGSFGRGGFGRGGTSANNGGTTSFGGGKDGARQAQGANGCDFGDRPSRPRNDPGTGANSAPLGEGKGRVGGAGGGFGGKSGGSFSSGNNWGETGGGATGSGSGFGTRGGGTGSTGFGGRGGGTAAGNGWGGRGGGTAAGNGWGGRGGGESTGGRNGRDGGNGFGNRNGRDMGAGGGGSFGSRNDSGNERGGGNFGRPFGGSERDGGGNRFGGAGGGSNFYQYASEEERASQEAHIPKDRPISEIVEEDTRVADNYKTIFEEDEECVVTGLPDGAPPQMLDNWADANFHEKLMANIERSKYIRPRKIQSLCIPLIMDGHDIKGHAETGSGKSAAFLLPIINTIIAKKKSGDYESKRICPFALIIEPTRELAYQLYDQARKLAENTGVTVSKAYGKFKRSENIREISVQGCDILVGTTGRLVDLFQAEYLMFEKMKILVLDEADQLLEDDFSRELRRFTKVPGWPENKDRQTLLFSATFAQEVQEWANDWLKKENVMISNKKLVDANSRVVQKFVKVNRPDKNNELLKLLQKEAEEAQQENPAEPPVKRTMVFVKMKRTADVLSTFLNVNKLKTTTINGDRPQKLREESLNHFRQGKYNVMVTTDVCARGIDIKELDHVINLDLPTDYTTYVHRIGRTGRLREGTATSFFDPGEDMDLAKDLVKGVKNVGQEAPEWLEQAAEGKLPVDDEPVAATTGSDGGGGWGSGIPFGGGANAANDEPKEAPTPGAENGDKPEEKGDEEAAATGNADENGTNGQNADGEGFGTANVQPEAQSSPAAQHSALPDDNDEW